MRPEGCTVKSVNLISSVGAPHPARQVIGLPTNLAAALVGILVLLVPAVALEDTLVVRSEDAVNQVVGAESLSESEKSITR
jgi:hypothetical protein